MVSPEDERSEPQGHFLRAGFGSPDPAPTSSRTSRQAANASAVQLIALMPVAQALLVTAHVVSMRGTTTWVFLWFVAAIGSVLSYVLAGADRDQLRGRGYDQLPSPFWTLPLPVIYLVLRARVVEKKDWAAYRPVWLYLGLIVLLAVLGYAAIFSANVISQLPSSSI